MEKNTPALSELISVVKFKNAIKEQEAVFIYLDQ